MTPPKKLSRRDAIKLLGAATGATLLANLPSKWSKPELASGALPAHAQTSCIAASFTIFANAPGTVIFSVILNGVSTGSYEVNDLNPTSLTFDYPCGSTGCLEIFISSLSVDGTIVFGTFSSPSNPNRIFNSVGGALLINLATGNYGTVVGPPVDGCLWGS